MMEAKALWAVVALSAVALSGCTDSGSDTLDMVVTGGADPLADPFTFKATGPAFEQYTWDLGDGTVLDGKEVEHTYGFSNGDVTVKLTACTGGECESILRSVPLGGDRNVAPVGSFKATTNWGVTGETIVLDASGSTDDNGDPILYRWACTRLEDLRPPDDGGGHSHGPPGVPFGVNALAVHDDTLTGGNDHGDNLCTDFAAGTEQAWSRDTATISGTFAESGLYRIEVFVRDPKSAAWIGRLDLYVADERPEEMITISHQGTLPGGSGGSVDDNCQAVQDQGGPECPTSDRIEYPFTLEIPIELATITMASDSPTGSAVWMIKNGPATLASGMPGETVFLGAGGLYNDREYTVVIEIDGGGLNVPYDFNMEIDGDMDPRHLYQLAPA